MIEKTTTTTVSGCRSGHVTCQNRFQPLAPSSEAASCRSVLIVCSPARSVMAKNGMPRHVFTTIAHQSAHSPLDRNGSFVTIKPDLQGGQTRTLKVGAAAADPPTAETTAGG